MPQTTSPEPREPVVGPPTASAVGRSMESGISTRQLVAVLAAAAAVRLFVGFVVLGDMPLQSDALQYAEAGDAIRADFPGHAPYFWPPGLIYYLAAVYSVLGAAPWVSRLAMIALGVASTALVVSVARLAFGRPRVALTAGWIAALYPPSVLMSAQTYTQELATVTLLGVAYAVLRLREGPRPILGIVGGLFLGFGVITRPSMISVVGLALVAGAIWAAWLTRTAGRPSGARAFVTLGLAMLGVASAVVPVMAQNARMGAGWSLSINNEMNIFMGNNPYTHYYKTSHLAQRNPDDLDPEVAAYLRSYIGADHARSRMRDATIRYVIGHPFTTAWRTLSRIRAFWGFDYIMSRAIQNDHAGSMGVLIAFLCFEAGGYLVAMLAILSGLVIAYRDGYRATAAVLVGLALAYQAPYALAFSSGTYHFPVMGLLFPIAALNVARPLREGPAFRVGERRVLGAAFAVLLLIQIEYGYFAATLSGL